MPTWSDLEPGTRLGTLHFEGTPSAGEIEQSFYNVLRELEGTLGQREEEDPAFASNVTAWAESTARNNEQITRQIDRAGLVSEGFDVRIVYLGSTDGYDNYRVISQWPTYRRYSTVTQWYPETFDATVGKIAEMNRGSNWDTYEQWTHDYAGGQSWSWGDAQRTEGESSAGEREHEAETTGSNQESSGSEAGGEGEHRDHNHVTGDPCDEGCEASWKYGEYTGDIAPGSEWWDWQLPQQALWSNATTSYALTWRVRQAGAEVWTSSQAWTSW